MDWQDVFTRGIAPGLSTPGLTRLYAALVADSPELHQGATTVPPPIRECLNMDVEAACAVGLCGVADGATTVDEVTKAFGRTMADASQRLGDTGIRYSSVAPFLNFFDTTPRDRMRAEFAPVVAAVLAARGVEVTGTVGVRAKPTPADPFEPWVLDECLSGRR